MKGVGPYKDKAGTETLCICHARWFSCVLRISPQGKTDPECSVPHPELAVKLSSIMEIQIMLIEMKFYSANVYFTLLCGEAQSGSEGADNVLFIWKML